MRIVIRSASAHSDSVEDVPVGRHSGAVRRDAVVPGDPRSYEVAA